jgi:OOP family OmpA-OmpF porin
MISQRAWRALLIAAAALVSTTAFAQSFVYPRAYLGIGLGQGRASLPSSAGQIGATAVTTASGTDHSPAWKLYAGYLIDSRWGFELGYQRLGDRFEQVLNTAGGSASAKAHLTSWYGAGTGTLELPAGFSVIGKLGLARTLTRLDSVCVGATCTDPRGGGRWAPLAGIGAEYALRNNYAIRLEYEDHGTVTANDYLSTGNSGSLRVSGWTLSAKRVF